MHKEEKDTRGRRKREEKEGRVKGEGGRKLEEESSSALLCENAPKQ